MKLFKKKFKLRMKYYFVISKICVEYSYSRFLDDWTEIRKYKHLGGDKLYVNSAMFDTIEKAEEFASQFKSINDVIKHEKKIDDLIEDYRKIPEKYEKILTP